MESPRSALDPRPELRSSELLPGSHCDKEPVKASVSPVVFPRALYVIPPSALIDCFLMQQSGASSHDGAVRSLLDPTPHKDGRDDPVLRAARTFRPSSGNPEESQTSDKIHINRSRQLIRPYQIHRQTSSNQIRVERNQIPDEARATFDPVDRDWLRAHDGHDTSVDLVGNLRAVEIVHTHDGTLSTLERNWLDASQFSAVTKNPKTMMANHLRPPGKSPVPTRGSAHHEQGKKLESTNGSRCSRSRSIAIKPSCRRRRCEDVDEPSLAAQLEYDCATWRLYNRIIDHRQKHPLCSDYNSQSKDPSTSESPAPFAPSMLNANTLESSVVGLSPKTLVSFDVAEDTRDEEIFHLEL